MLFCLIGGYAGFNCARRIQKDWAEAQRFADSKLELIGKNWDVDALAALHPEGLTDSQRAVAEAMTKLWRERYGPYVSGTGKVVSFNSRTTTGGAWTDFAYSGNIVCSKRPATIYMQIRRQDGAWCIVRVNLTDRE